MSKKNHAERNERLCNQLCTEEVYFDWVVTTAFYSALHYVQHEIFPLDEGTKKFPTFENYYNSFFPIGHRKPSKHKVTMDLVYDNIPEAGDNYKWLHDTCRTARYHNYGMPIAVAKTAQERLAEIKEYLTK